MSDSSRRRPFARAGGAIAAFILAYAGWRIIVTNDAIARRDLMAQQVRDTQVEILRNQAEMLGLLKGMQTP